MSNATLRVPKLCKHSATGQAVVRLNGKDLYLGPHGTAAAKAEYDRKIAEWLANGRQLPDADGRLSVAELIVAYIRHAETYYTKAGAATTEYELIRQSMKWLKESHARICVDEFGPRAFK